MRNKNNTANLTLYSKANNRHILCEYQIGSFRPWSSNR